MNAVGFGWRKAIRQSHCRRKDYSEIVQDTSSSHATMRRGNTNHASWEYMVENGKWAVEVCFGDSGREQVGQKVTIEGKAALSNVDTPAGVFHEVAIEVDGSGPASHHRTGVSETGRQDVPQRDPISTGSCRDRMTYVIATAVQDARQFLDTL